MRAERACLQGHRRRMMRSQRCGAATNSCMSISRCCPEHPLVGVATAAHQGQWDRASPILPVPQCDGVMPPTTPKETPASSKQIRATASVAKWASCVASKPAEGAQCPTDSLLHPASAAHLRRSSEYTAGEQVGTSAISQLNSWSSPADPHCCCIPPKSHATHGVSLSHDSNTQAGLRRAMSHRSRQVPQALGKLLPARSS